MFLLAPVIKFSLNDNGKLQNQAGDKMNYLTP